MRKRDRPGAIYLKHAGARTDADPLHVCGVCVYMCMGVYVYVYACIYMYVCVCLSVSLSVFLFVFVWGQSVVKGRGIRAGIGRKKSPFHICFVRVVSVMPAALLENEHIA
jgi:hypothetical protein